VLSSVLPVCFNRSIPKGCYRRSKYFCKKTYLHWMSKKIHTLSSKDLN